MNAATTDVLIVGAGPVGLVLACQLARLGVACRIVDKGTGPVAESRATDVHARTLELLEPLGVVDELIRRGRRAHAVHFYAGGRRVAGFATSVLESPFPFILGVPQFETENVLVDRLRELGVTVERSTTLVSFEQSAAGVDATLRGGDGPTEHVAARWIVGSDGANSTVRACLGLPFEGETYEEHFMLADVRMRWDLSFDELHLFLSPHGFFMALPMPGDDMVRVFVDVPAERSDLAPTRATFDTLARERVDAPHTLLDAGWMSRFRVHRRMVPRYRVGRAFLAGDAAHVHSPVGGQGMNMGVQDAVDLGWKLGLVARGSARPELLDSYHAERHAAAERTLRDTHLATSLSLLKIPWICALRDLLGAATRDVSAVQRWLAEVTAALDANLRDSPIVASHRGSLLAADVVRDLTTEEPSVGEWLAFGRGPEAGDRVPYQPFGALAQPAWSSSLVDGDRHVLLLFDGLAATPEGYANLRAIAADIRARHGDDVRVRIVVPVAETPPALADEADVIHDPGAALHHTFAASAECAYVLRPDGYIAFRAQPAHALAIADYLDHILVARR